MSLLNGALRDVQTAKHALETLLAQQSDNGQSATQRLEEAIRLGQDALQQAQGALAAPDTSQPTPGAPDASQTPPDAPATPDADYTGPRASLTKPARQRFSDLAQRRYDPKAKPLSDDESAELDALTVANNEGAPYVPPSPARTTPTPNKPPRKPPDDPTPPNDPADGGGNKNPPPVILGFNRYTAQPGEIIKVHGDYLKDASSATVNGVSAVIQGKPKRVHFYLEVPDGATTGPISVTTPHGSAISKRILKIEAAADDAKDDGPDTPPPGKGKKKKNYLGWPGEDDSDEGEFDLTDAITSIGRMAPYRLRPAIRHAAFIAQAVGQARGGAMRAGLGQQGISTWLSHSAHNSAVQRAGRSRALAQRMAARAPSEQQQQHLQDRASRSAARAQRMADADSPRADLAQQVAAQRAQRAQAAAHRADRARQAQQVAGTRTRAAAGAVAGGAAAGFTLGQVAGQSGVGGAIGGAVGMAAGPVGSAVGQAVGLVVEATIGAAVKAVKKSVANVGQVGDLGAQTVDHLTSGLKSASRAVFNVGADLAQTLVSGILRPLGSSGGALSGLFAQTTRTLGNVLDGVFDAAAKTARGAGRVGGLALGVGAAGVGAMAGYNLGGGGLAGGLMGGMMVNLPAIGGAVVGALVATALAVVVAKVVSAVAEMAGGILSVFGRLAGELGKVVVGVLKTVQDVVQDVTSQLLKTTRNILDLAQQTGMSVANAIKGVQSNAAFGIGINPQGAQNAMIQRPMLAALGLGNSEPGSMDFNRAFRQKFESWLGVFGGNPILANPMTALAASATGQDEGGLRRLGNLPKAVFERQAQRSEAMQSAFGLSPAIVAKTQQDFSLLMASVTEFVSLLKNKVASELIPYLSGALDKGIAFVKDHAPQISEFIHTAVASAVKYVGVFADFMVNKMPLVLLGAAEKVVDWAILIAQAIPPIFEMLMKHLGDLLASVQSMAASIEWIVRLVSRIPGAPQIPERPVAAPSPASGADEEAPEKKKKKPGPHDLPPPPDFLPSAAEPPLHPSRGTQKGGYLDPPDLRVAEWAAKKAWEWLHPPVSDELPAAPVPKGKTPLSPTANPFLRAFGLNTPTEDNASMKWLQGLKQSLTDTRGKVELGDTDAQKIVRGLKEALSDLTEYSKRTAEATESTDRAAQKTPQELASLREWLGLMGRYEHEDAWSDMRRR